MSEVVTSLTELEALLLIRSLGTGCLVNKKGKSQKLRAFTTYIKVLYQLLFYEKNLYKNGEKWKDIHFSVATIAKHAQISEKSVSRIINSDFISIFLDIKKRGRKKDGTQFTHTYRLKKEFIKAMFFLERNGLFKGMRENYVKWRERFNKRLDKWIIPGLMAGNSLQYLWDQRNLKRKIKLSTSLYELSTKNDRKSPTEDDVKVPGLLFSGSATPNGYYKRNAIELEFDETLGRLKMLGFSNHQRENFLRNNPLGVMGRASKQLEERINRKDLEPLRTMGGYLQGQINILRFGKIRN